MQESEEERKRKAAETAAKLAAYRRSVGADDALEEEHREEIERAQKEAKQLMRFGATREALEQLQKVSRPSAWSRACRA